MGRNQLEHTAPRGNAARLCGKAWFPPVSYTHLDVYKRQGTCIVSTWTIIFLIGIVVPVQTELCFELEVLEDFP